jgi:hypothetical protein
MQSPLLATLVNSRITFVIVLLVGMAMCTAGIGKAARLGLWVHPLSIAGYILGAWRQSSLSWSSRSSWLPAILLEASETLT